MIEIPTYNLRPDRITPCEEIQDENISPPNVLPANVCLCRQPMKFQNYTKAPPYHGQWPVKHTTSKHFPITIAVNAQIWQKETPNYFHQDYSLNGGRK